MIQFVFWEIQQCPEWDFLHKIQDSSTWYLKSNLLFKYQVDSNDQPVALQVSSYEGMLKIINWVIFTSHEPNETR